MNLREYPDSEMMMMAIADSLAGQLEQHLLSHDHASFAVPGGTTPGPIFDAMCAARHLDWSRIHVMLTDERWLPETSERSNTRLLRERLLVEAAAQAHYVPLYGGTATPEESLARLADGVHPHLPLTVALLGMGADMHTASIFPGADKLDEALSGDAVLVAMRAPNAPEPRITLSAQVLKGAMSRHIVIIGHEKREALERAQGLTPQEAPVAAILANSTVHWAEK